MRQAMIQLTSYNIEPGLYLIIETMNDWLEYVQEHTDELQQDLEKVIKSKVNPERWDHFPNPDISFATSIAKIRESSPISEISRLVEKKHSMMFELLEKGEILLVNENGGYCTMLPAHKILESWEYQKPSRQIVQIAEKPSLINLEKISKST